MSLCRFHRGQIGALSEKLSISVIPICEAVKQLAERGLVCANPDVSYHVIKLSDTDVRDIFEFRKPVEPFAVEEGIKNYLKQVLKNCPPKKLRVRFDQTDVKLHQGLITKSGSKFAKLFYLMMDDLASIVRHLNERIDLAVQEHLGTIDVLIERDLTEVKNKLCWPLENSAKRGFRFHSDLEWSQKKPFRTENLVL